VNGCGGVIGREADGEEEIDVEDLKDEELIASMIVGFLAAILVGLFFFGVGLMSSIGPSRSIGLGLITFIVGGVVTTWRLLVYYAKQAIAAEKRDCDG
jgi:protein-S-isoprenylcysteine O-methyltransferase Ste14